MNRLPACAVWRQELPPAPPPLPRRGTGLREGQGQITACGQAYHSYLVAAVVETGTAHRCGHGGGEEQPRGAISGPIDDLAGELAASRSISSSSAAIAVPRWRWCGALPASVPGKRGWHRVKRVRRHGNAHGARNTRKSTRRSPNVSRPWPNSTGAGAEGPSTCAAPSDPARPHRCPPPGHAADAGTRSLHSRRTSCGRTASRCGRTGS